MNTQVSDNSSTPRQESVTSAKQVPQSLWQPLAEDQQESLNGGWPGGKWPPGNGNGDGNNNNAQCNGSDQ